MDISAPGFESRLLYQCLVTLDKSLNLSLSLKPMNGNLMAVAM